MCSIYGLVSSDRPDVVRYVGKTTLGADKRLRLHLSAAKKGRTAVQRWIAAHVERGDEIRIVILRDDAQWDGDEEQFIAEYRQTGKLLNHLDGGQGTLGLKWGKASRARASLARTGSVVPEAARRKISAALKGHKRTSEARAKQAASVSGEANHFYGRSHSAESREANGRARAKLTDDQVQSLRAQYASGTPQAALAIQYGISQAQVSAVVNGRAYRWLGLGPIKRAA